MEILTLGLSIFATVVTVSYAYSAYVSARSATQSAALQRGTHDLGAFREFILHEYVEREFKATDAPIIGGEPVTLLRKAKSKGMKEYWDSPEKWDKASGLANEGSPQNRVAFETSWALQNLGSAAFTGVLPLNMLLAIAADVVIDDWLLCRAFVKDYQEREKSIALTQTNDAPPVNYHRRHAEWLVLVAVAWMARHWSYKN